MLSEKKKKKKKKSYSQNSSEQWAIENLILAQEHLWEVGQIEEQCRYICLQGIKLISVREQL